MDQVKKRKNRNEIGVYNRRIDRKIQAGLERLTTTINKVSSLAEKNFTICIVKFKEPPTPETFRYYYLFAVGIAKELPKYDQRCKSAIFHLQHDDHKNLKQINLEIILA